MADLKRRRHGTVATRNDQGVRIANRVVDFDSYADIMTNRRETVIERLSVRTQITDRLIEQACKALVCGRVVKQNTADLKIYERTEYCRQRRLCIGCYAAARSAAVAAQMADSQSLVGNKLLHIILTTPRPQTTNDETHWTAVAAKAMTAIRKQLTRWQRRIGDCYKIPSYVIGLHSKQDADTGLLWPHIHVGVVVNELCQVNGSDGLLQTLQFAYAAEIPDAACPKVNCENLGIIKSDSQLRRHRKEVSLTRTAHLLAYVSRSTEDDDTPESLARRDSLNMSLGIDSTHKRSRRTSDGSGIQRAQVAHAFPPDRLGDSQAYIFPFSGEPYAITANRVDEAKRQLLREAKSIVCSHLSIDQSE